MIDRFTARRAARHVFRIAVATAAFSAITVVVVTSAGATLAGSSFNASDGNLEVNSEAKDWANTVSCTSAQQVAWCGLDKPPATDDSFGSGFKEDTVAPSVVTGSIPSSKSDLTRLYVAIERAGGKQFLYLAWERAFTLSATVIDFELNQATTLSANGVTPVRTAGDILITYNSLAGLTPFLVFHRWVITGSSAAAECEAATSFPCWGTQQSLAGFSEGSINSGNVTDPIAPNNPRTLGPGTFGEMAINLTDSGFFPVDCVHFGSVFVKGRASSSFNAEVKDFIAPVSVNIGNCSTTCSTAFDFDFSGSEYTDCFRAVQRGGDIDVGTDASGTGHDSLVFSGGAGPAGGTWLTVYDATPMESDPGPTFGEQTLCADVIFAVYNNVKGAGVVGLLNEGVGKEGLALVLSDAGNTDRLRLATVDGDPDKKGKLTFLPNTNLSQTNVALGAAIKEHVWYRLVMTIDPAATTTPKVTGKVFAHQDPEDPNSPLGAQIGGTVTYAEAALPAGVTSPGQDAILAQAVSTVVDLSVTNFSNKPDACVPGF